MAGANTHLLKQVGLNIAYHRKLKGLSQEKLSERAGISRTHLSNIESCNTPSFASIDTLLRIAEALEVKPSALFEIR